MKKLFYLIVLALILGLVLTGCLLSNVGQVPATEQSGITYLTKAVDSPLVLAARWDFNTITAGTVADLSGNPNTGNVFGATLVDSGHTGYGNALSFNGVYDRVEVAHSSSLNITGTGITLEAWINATEFPTTGRDVTINKTDAYALQVADNGKVRVYLGPLSSIQTDDVVLSINTWQHIAGTYDGANVRIYVDGDLKKTLTKTGDQATSTNPLVIGKRDPGTTNTDGAFKGLIDEVRIWGSALTVSKLDDMTPPAITINTPANGGTYFLNHVVNANWSVTDGDGTGVAYENGTVPSGSPIETGLLGTKTFMVTATDYAKNIDTKTVTYYVNYNWTGFFSPVDNLPTQNVAKAGSAIPVKFSLSGDQGLDIFESGYPNSVAIDCDSGDLNDNIEVTVNAVGSSLKYDATADQYIYVWKTEKTWAGTCRQLQVKLIDGTLHLANFKFK